jgi:hypothetical protein
MLRELDAAALIGVLSRSTPTRGLDELSNSSFDYRSR